MDDIIIFGRETDKLLSELTKKFKIKDLGEAKQILGIRLFKQDDGSIYLSQRHHIEELLKDYGMEDCKETFTPMQSNIKLEPATDEEFEEFKKSGFNYRSAVGRLAYITQCTRIDLCFTSGVLSQFLEKTSMSHVQAFKRLLRYLKQYTFSEE